MQVIIQLVELVEISISKELRDMVGAIFYDGWAHAGIHNIRIFLSYCVEKGVKIDGKLKTSLSHSLTLISVSSMANVAYDTLEENENTDDETVFFNTRNTNSIFQATDEVFET